MDLQLTNKKALVTGSTAGIGFAVASLLAQEGAAVVVNGRSQRRVALHRHGPQRPQSMTAPSSASAASSRSSAICF